VLGEGRKIFPLHSCGTKRKGKKRAGDCLPKEQKEREKLRFRLTTPLSLFSDFEKKKEGGEKRR